MREPVPAAAADGVLEELRTVLDRIGGRRVVVVGDVMLDEYLIGRVRRVSPEAPVPVVELQERTATPGGAGNAAANIAGLGGVVSLSAVVGADDNGDRLRTALVQAGVDPAGLRTDPDRPTTTKTRLVAGQQQIARVDVEDPAPLSDGAAAAVQTWFSDVCDGASAVLLCDYGKGVLGARLCAGLIAQARRRGLPVVVDPKGADFAKYRGATVVTPNVAEAQAATQHVRPEPVDAQARARHLVGQVDGTAVLLTRGARGMTLFRPAPSGAVEELSVLADARHVYDVTGAGDTVVAVLALALAAGAPLAPAMRLANMAAGLVVARPGTTVLDAEDVHAAITARAAMGTMEAGGAMRARGTVGTRGAIAATEATGGPSGRGTDVRNPAASR